MTDLQAYASFIAQKHRTATATGFFVDEDTLNPHLFPFQRAIVQWALHLGKAAIFAECGLGKTLMQLAWAEQIIQHTQGRVLILAPLAVQYQTCREGERFGIPVSYVRHSDRLPETGVFITNYEMLENIDPAAFVGVVLDESSILKNFVGKTKTRLLEAFQDTPYRLCCTATPAPNDHTELGNHAEFLGVMASSDMLTRFFKNDSMKAKNLRLKEHARTAFWTWVTSWAVCLSTPGDLGDSYAMDSYKLPSLDVIDHYLGLTEASMQRAKEKGQLFLTGEATATQIHKVKRDSLAERVAKVCEIVAGIPDTEQIAIWCETNEEAETVCKALPHATEVRGSDSAEYKEQTLMAFSEGQVRILVTKPSIAGFGLNWQQCAHTIFVGVSYSFEKTYQAIKRFHRFGQTRPVQVHVIYSHAEGDVLQNLRAKERDFAIMQADMNAAMYEHGLFRQDAPLRLSTPQSQEAFGERWAVLLGDCVTEALKIPDNSIGLTVTSPPFLDQYSYSPSEFDMGNASDDDEFMTHFKYLIAELHRITMPGRNVVIHCKDMPLFQTTDGISALNDFPGKIVRAFLEFDKPNINDFERVKDYQEAVALWKQAGHKWGFHSRVTIWKDPKIEQQKTQTHGLLHRTFTDGSEACRQGLADYLLIFRKWPTEGGIHVTQQRQAGDFVGVKGEWIESFHETNHRSEALNKSIQKWREYASPAWHVGADITDLTLLDLPVWEDIQQTRVLNGYIARDGDDEKHICPLQLDVIARCIDLWSARGDIVFDPFTGIGSTGYEAVKRGRAFIGTELKESYYRTAQKYLAAAEIASSQLAMF